ncbi:hypothetical protein HJ124_15360 [Vibrio parahaemolyticus]|nr:hypothetical protein [Vibrio parahaemolyticus]
MLIPGNTYTREEIQGEVGGEMPTYLPQNNNRILAGCFNEELNPNCPNEVQVKDTSQRNRKAELLMNQQDNIFPVFVKPTSADKLYRYIGTFRCIGGSDETQVLKEAEERSGRHGDLSYVLYLEQVT